MTATVNSSCELGVKFVLFLYCLSLRNKSSQVRVLWEDHRNDLFINFFGKVASNSIACLQLSDCFW